MGGGGGGVREVLVCGRVHASHRLLGAARRGLVGGRVGAGRRRQQHRRVARANRCRCVCPVCCCHGCYHHSGGRRCWCCSPAEDNQARGFFRVIRLSLSPLTSEEPLHHTLRHDTRCTSMSH